MTEQELDKKFEDYANKYPVTTCVFHNDLNTIKNLPMYLKLIVSSYIDEAENNPDIDHINSFRVEPQGANAHAIFYSHTPK